MRQAPASDLHPELRAEPHVSLEYLSHVLDPVAQHQRSLDPHAERKTGVPVRVDAARCEHLTVDHPAATPLDPAGATTRAAVLIGATADEAPEVQLGAGFGEREVGRPKARLEALPEELLDEVVEGATQVSHGQPLGDRRASTRWNNAEGGDM